MPETFEQWLQNTTKRQQERDRKEAEQEKASAKGAYIQNLLDLGDINDLADGGYEVRCCHCGDWVEMVIDPIDYDPDFGYYCGRGGPSPCIP